MGCRNYYCDDCGNDIIKGDKSFPDYDDITRCEPCFWKEELRQKTDAREKLIAWLRNTHLKQVKKLSKEIKIATEKVKDLV